MTDSKNLLTVIVSASIAVLIAVCLGLFWLTWTSLQETERVKEENHQLLLGNTVCKMRLENIQGAGNATPQTQTNAASDLSSLPVTPSDSAGSRVAQSPQTSASTTPAAKPQNASTPAVSAPAPSSSTRADEENAAADLFPADESAATLKHPWFVQLSAYSKEARAKKFVLEIEDILTEAGIKAKPQVVKQGSLWLVILDVPTSKPTAMKSASALKKATGLEATIVQLSR